MLNIVTWNVRGLKRKKNEKKNIAVISEAKNKLQARKDIEDYSLMYKGINQDKRAAPRVAVMADEKWNRIILSYIFDNERIVMTMLSSD